jgi:hypothetical protein
MEINSNNVLQYLHSKKINEVIDQGNVEITPKYSDNFTFLDINVNDSHRIIVKQEQFYRNKKGYNRVDKDYKVHQFQQTYFKSQKLFESKIYDQIHSIVAYASSCRSKNFTEIQEESKLNDTQPIRLASSLGIFLSGFHLSSYNNSHYSEFFKCNVTNTSNRLNTSYNLLYHPDIVLLSKEFPPETYSFLNVFQTNELMKEEILSILKGYIPQCLIHNNLRFDNLFIDSSSLNNENLVNFELTNWEDACFGDITFDIGTIVANYLIIWLDSLLIHPTINLRESIELSSVSLHDIQKLIQSFLESYLKHSSMVKSEYDDFICKVTKSAGLSLLYSTIDKLKLFQGFNNQSVCTMQIAKKLILDTKESKKTVLGLF